MHRGAHGIARALGPVGVQGARSPAGHLLGLQHVHFQAGAGQGHRSGKPVGAGSDDHGVGTGSAHLAIVPAGTSCSRADGAAASVTGCSGGWPPLATNQADLNSTVTYCTVKARLQIAVMAIPARTNNGTSTITGS